MADEREPFRLEDESEDVAPAAESAPAGSPKTPAPPPADRGGNGRLEAEEGGDPAPTSKRVWRRPAEPGDPDADVDQRTVAERAGRAVERVAGSRPSPPGWPGEALAFPIRARRYLLVGSVLCWVVLDVLGWVNLFLGALLKVVAYAFFLRWQLHVASMTAAGRDEVTSWADASEMDRSQVRSLVGLLAWAVFLLGPGAVLLLLGHTTWGVVLLLVGSAWLAVAAIGDAVGDPTLVRPWNAAAWIGSRPLGLLAGSIGWWAAGFVEWVCWTHAPDRLLPAVLLFTALRTVFVYVWLSSARALGVVGRDWSPYGTAGREDAA